MEATKGWANGPFPLLATSKTTGAKGKEKTLFMADEMALAHNALTRSLNAMYYQAPYVTKPQDIRDFMTYTTMWHEFIHHHHGAEEQILFPNIERLCEKPGLMEGNISQHHTFAPGLETFREYAQSCREGKDTYDAIKYKQIIDSFASEMSKHLKEEVDTLLSLDPWAERIYEEAFVPFENHLRATDKNMLYPMVLGAHDDSFKDVGKWPIVPFFVPYLVHYWFERTYQGAWRFSPSDTWGRIRAPAFGPCRREEE